MVAEGPGGGGGSERSIVAGSWGRAMAPPEVQVLGAEKTRPSLWGRAHRKESAARGSSMQPWPNSGDLHPPSRSEGSCR